MNSLQITPRITNNNYQNNRTHQTISDNKVIAINNSGPSTSFKGTKINVFFVGLIAFAIGYSSLFEYHHTPNIINVGSLGGGLFTMIMTALVGIFGKNS